MIDHILEIVKYAKSNVPFYQELYKDIILDNIYSMDNLRVLPIICKGDIIESDFSILAKPYESRIYTDELITFQTSGSTGQCLKVLWNVGDYNNSLFTLWLKRWKQYNILPSDRRCFFFTNQNYMGRLVPCDNIFYSNNCLFINKSNLDKYRLKSICEMIFEFNPKWMILQPSIASLLCDTIDEFSLTPNSELSYIELTGEMLFRSVRNRIERTFLCKTANQYGCVEGNSIAYECEYGNLHLMSDSNYVEVINDSGKSVFGIEGDICITTLTNHTMPFIRYRIGDRGVLYPSSKCKCGNKGNILEISSGRNNDYIIDSNGNKVNAYIFASAVEIINDNYDEIIKQFQVIQKGIDCFTVKISIESCDYNDEKIRILIKKIFLDNILEYSLNSAKFDFEFYTSLLPDTKTGKLSYFRREF